ncbi:uncharacterized protein FOMMEDRAFT_152213 [Fomitiporia mediterranea MF3/22]|uniref:uncharacterized protein n=1 Tax=Fomitiporia mediterranea (strain MF3/22) TaxID=694068 RepID=UPI00044078B9|nr:uncharacterized protein FOMMEDRAFT_152213 [Fomitiporia mediterranea MF3/22]EJD06888.1 hypothetical protein FOMMEDRAFT_152213 [Fomitiporia mediterranea MF3/22]
MNVQVQQLLKAAFPLARSYGFTRQALSQAALLLPKPHSEPLPDTAVTALFGSGDDAPRTFFKAWLAEGRNNMEESEGKSINGLLKHRLRWNEPVLQSLPETFALMASPSLAIPPFDVRPAVEHVASIADQACYLSGDKSTENSWYAKRAVLAAAYGAAELHQLSSPSTAAEFLDDLLKSSREAEFALQSTAQFAQFVGRSWAGIYRSLRLR